VKKKIEVPVPSIPAIDSSSENLLSQFSGEPQIVESFVISQLTPREPAPGTAFSGSSPYPQTTTDSLKGTYVISLLLHCMQSEIFCSSSSKPSRPLERVFIFLLLVFVLLVLSTPDQHYHSSRESPISQLKFVEIIKDLQATPSPMLNPPLFIFNLSEEAAAYNAEILAAHNFDLDQIIKTQHPSQISYGSEFHSV